MPIEQTVNEGEKPVEEAKGEKPVEEAKGGGVFSMFKKKDRTGELDDLKPPSLGFMNNDQFA